MSTAQITQEPIFGVRCVCLHGTGRVAGDWGRAQLRRAAAAAVAVPRAGALLPGAAGHGRLLQQAGLGFRVWVLALGRKPSPNLLQEARCVSHSLLPPSWQAVEAAFTVQDIKFFFLTGLEHGAGSWMGPMSSTNNLRQTVHALQERRARTCKNAEWEGSLTDWLPLRPCRCLPQASAALQAQLIDSVTAEAAAHASAGASALTAYFNNPAQRLQRYIGDIRKGFSIIIAAGACALFWRLRRVTEDLHARSRGACAGLWGICMRALMAPAQDCAEPACGMHSGVAQRNVMHDAFANIDTGKAFSCKSGLRAQGAWGASCCRWCGWSCCGMAPASWPG